MSKYIGKRVAHPSREERTYRKHRRMFVASVVLWALAVIGLLLWNLSPLWKHVEQESAAEETPIVQIIDEIEAIPMEYNPVRDDIPMDAEHQKLLYKACGETGIRYELALAVIWQETDFRNIEGDGGESHGYMQVQKKHHEERMERLGVTDLNDPYSNFLVGCDYLIELDAKGNGIEWMLMAYNGGPSYANDMAKAGTVSQYAKNVLNYMEILED
jgi:hypothetical protein